MLIPKKLHFVFLSKQGPAPEIFNYCLKVAIEKHPGWEINVYNYDEANAIVDKHFPELTDFYYALSLDVQRADIIRILLLYLYGGFYLDIDICCFKSLEPLRRYSLVLGEEKFLSDEMSGQLNLKNPLRVANYMFGSIARHSFWLELLNMIIERSHRQIKEENDVLESTGPAVITDCYHSIKTHYPDIVVLRNFDRLCVTDGHREIGCHFGNYAAHLHIGSWRWSWKNESIQTPMVNIRDRSQLVTTKYIVPKNTYTSFQIDIFLNSRNDNYVESICEVISKLNSIKNAIGNLSLMLSVIGGIAIKEIHQLEIQPASIWIAGFELVVFSDSELAKINNSLSNVIVPADYIKDHYQNAGVTIPMTIVEPTFKRYSRKFDEFSGTDYFMIGCIANTFNISTLNELVDSCQKIVKESVPILKLTIYDPDNKCSGLLPNLSQFVQGVISRPLTDLEMAAWFHELDIMVIGYDDNFGSSILKEVLYLGIPAIVPDIKAYNYISSIRNSGALIYYGQGCDRMINAIKIMYTDYESYFRCALETSREIEDQWSDDQVKVEIIDILSKLSRHYVGQ